MKLKVFALTACFLALSAFSVDDQTKMATACSNSLMKAKELGRPIPDTLVKNRDPICKCVAEGVGKDTTIPSGDKPKITQVFEKGAAGDPKAAREIRQSLDKSVNVAMRKLTRGCSRPYMEAARKEMQKKKEKTE